MLSHMKEHAWAGERLSRPSLFCRVPDWGRLMWDEMKCEKMKMSRIEGHGFINMIV